MSINLTVNGVTFAFPTAGENPGWGSTVTAWAQAVSQATLQKSGGTFTLTGEVDFGASYGLKLAVLKSRTTGAAQSGFMRLAKTDTINFRNAAGDGDLAFGVGSVDTVPAYAGKNLVNVDAAQTLYNKTLDGSTTSFSAIPWSSIDKTSSNLTDLTTKSHTALSDIGTNTHAQIDTHISNDTDEKLAAKQTGIASWGSGTTYYTITGGKLQVDRGGTGYVSGIKVTWAGGQQTSAIPANDTQYVYMNSSGTIGMASTADQTTYESNIVLFEVLYDGTNYVVVREDHPYSFNTGTSVYLHRTVGPVISGTGAVVTRVATGTGAANGDREIKIVGDAKLEDHGLTTTISDTAGVGVTWNVYYTNGSGFWRRYLQQSQLPMVYNNAGTPGAITSGRYSVYALYVSKADLNSSTPTYFAVMDSAQYTSLSGANAAITNNTISRSTGELAELELAQLGYAIVQNSGGGYINQLTVAKSTATTSYSAGGTNQAALTVTTTTSFNGRLSGSDATVQAALETLDDSITAPNLGGTGVANNAAATLTLSTHPVTLTTSNTTSLTLPPSGTVATLAGSEVLENKTLEATCALVDTSDNTKTLKWNLAAQSTGVDITVTTGAETADRTLNIPVLGGNRTLVMTDLAQVITAKDIDGGTASDTSRITVPKAATATLEGLTRKQGTIVFDTTTNTPKYDDGSSLVAFTAGAVADTNRNGMTVENLSISATVGSNALTIALKDSAGNDPSAGSPVKIGFRSATATDGSYVVRSVSAATSVVVSSGSTLGTSNGVAATLNVYAVDNAGTVVLGVINGMLDDSFVQSSTAEGGAGAADSSGVLYTTSAQTSKSIRWIGRITVTEATAGTWATAPSQVHSGPRPPYQVGRTDGVAPASGMVGEVVSSTITSTTGLSTAMTDVTGASLQLGPGSWVIRYSVSAYVTTQALAGAISGVSVQITDSSNNKIGTSLRSFLGFATAAVAATFESCLCGDSIVNISSTTTYKLRAMRRDGAGTGTGAAIYNDGSQESNFYAIRIA